MKYADRVVFNPFATVAPHMGAWIEILFVAHGHIVFPVAPHMGAWIEISLKQTVLLPPQVAPHMGAWIEIF